MDEPLELTAFDSGITDIRDPRLIYADIPEPARPAGVRQQKKRDDAPSKSAQKRRAERQVRKMIAPAQTAVDDLNRRRENERRRAVAVTTANKDHLQGEKHPSDNRTRKEPVRENCKQRPTKTKGRGASRSFVPWCDRKR